MTFHYFFHCRTQSIVSVSEHASKDSAVGVGAAKDEKGASSSAAKSIKTRRRKKVSSISMSEAAKAKRDPQERTIEGLDLLGNWFSLRVSEHELNLESYLFSQAGFDAV